MVAGRPYRGPDDHIAVLPRVCARVAMSEMVQAFQVIVLVCYGALRATRDAVATRWLAVSLSLLFFTKYNYFILLAVPLVCHLFTVDALGTPAARSRGVPDRRRRWCATGPRRLVTVVCAAHRGGHPVRGWPFGAGSEPSHCVQDRGLFAASASLRMARLRAGTPIARAAGTSRRLAAKDPATAATLLMWFVVPLPCGWRRHSPTTSRIWCTWSSTSRWDPPRRNWASPPI